MQRIRLLYEQIEEAKRLMLSGTPTNLRLALILLDNAAELVMHRELSYRFAQDDYYARLTEPSERKYSDEERRKAEQEFKPMVSLLHHKLHMISEKQATVLCVCHEMRRDAFHRGEMNATILRPVTELLFLTVCDLAKVFPVHSYAIAGGVPSGENADFMARFQLDRPDTLGDEGTKESIYRKLIEGIAFDFSLRQTLSGDLQDRIAAIIDGLAYLNDSNSDRKILDHNLRYTQFWRERGAEVMKKAHEEGRAPKDDLDVAYREWSENPGARYTMDKIERWGRQASAIARAKHLADALAKYIGIERLIAPLEEDVDDAVFDFDEHINMLVKAYRSP
jgi:hypothetical protein